MTSKKTKSTLQHDINSASIITSYELKYAEKCLQMEEARYESLGRMAANLLTATSIVSVAFVGVLQILERGGYLSNFFSHIFVVLAAIFLLASLTALFLSFWRIKYEAIEAGEKSLEERFQEEGVEKTGLRSIWCSSNAIARIYLKCTNSLIKRNDLIRRYLQFSLVLLLGATLWIGLFLLHIAFMVM